ncbi:MAG: UDP-N-acetylmuramate dehydrogenase [Desulfovibrionaceae bacterium]|nr:UDP-N-acetylmuramate dehydrogenase [Desulfovibrionaceae bacterium]
MHETFNPSLADLTTLGLGGTASLLLEPETVDECALVEERLKTAGLKPLVIGLGSNMLAQDGDHPLILIRPAFERKIALVETIGEQVVVRASASLPLPHFLIHLAKASLTGLEGLSGIPGSVGGAIAMNAGSFGTTIGDRIRQVSLWHKGREHSFLRDKLTFGYRSFVHPFSCPEQSDALSIITSAEFVLTRGERKKIFAAMAGYTQRKRATQPVCAKSAGCVFKNPAGEYAGRLLEACGLKGKTRGGVGFSTLHANFLLNLQKGSAKDALWLLRYARDAVESAFGIALELEVRVVPCLQT